MQDLNTELENEGHDVQVVILNGSSASSSVSKLANVCDFPVFQDTYQVNAWNLHAGGKDDIIIYNSDGTLSSFLEYGGSTSINLGMSLGYNSVKAKILEAY